MPLGTLLSGLLMIGMALLAVVLAFTGPAMSSDGWQTRAAATLQHLATRAADALAWLPGWAVALAVLAGLAGLVFRSLHSRGRRSSTASPWPAHRTEPHSTTEPDRKKTADTGVAERTT